jgi:hypothetical protein
MRDEEKRKRKRIIYEEDYLVGRIIYQDYLYIRIIYEEKIIY